MKASELRLGNYLMYNGQQRRVFSVDAFGQLHFDAIKRTPRGNASECEGVALTSEWLERFGFKKENEAGTGWFITVNYRRLVWRYSDGLIELERIVHDDSDSFFSIPCRHVHQLQNLYFALTGRELELKAL